MRYTKPPSVLACGILFVSREILRLPKVHLRQVSCFVAPFRWIQLSTGRGACLYIGGRLKIAYRPTGLMRLPTSRGARSYSFEFAPNRINEFTAEIAGESAAAKESRMHQYVFCRLRGSLLGQRFGRVMADLRNAGNLLDSGA